MAPKTVLGACMQNFDKIHAELASPEQFFFLIPNLVISHSVSMTHAAYGVQG